MKVFVVIISDYSGMCEPVAVFTKIESALAYTQLHPKSRYSEIEFNPPSIPIQKIKCGVCGKPFSQTMNSYHKCWDDSVNVNHPE